MIAVPEIDTCASGSSARALPVPCGQASLESAVMMKPGIVGPLSADSQRVVVHVDSRAGQFEFGALPRGDRDPRVGHLDFRAARRLDQDSAAGCIADHET